MAAPQREIALRLPARLVRHLRAVAQRENTEIGALIVEALRRDLALTEARRRRNAPKRALRGRGVR